MRNKLFFFIFALILMIFTTGCEQKVEYKFLQNIENIEKIEVVIFGESKSSLQPELTIKNELSDESISEFLKDFSDLECYKYLTDPGRLSIGDTVLKISYSNGEYELINEDAQGRFKNNKYIGIGKYYFDDKLFYELLSKYTNIK
ncbi:MAG: hypothetical protein FD141_47 [Fusobacteria bacterium]|nr:MAG: hypothetical protein FD141_47 [Fusobacteriota bacterium]KAF0229289.1 MAG: hypothetical protein FD182_1545 [Fusobacteriota bacterium]